MAVEVVGPTQVTGVGDTPSCMPPARRMRLPARSASSASSRGAFRFGGLWSDAELAAPMKFF